MWNNITNEEVNTKIYWCKNCKVPLIKTEEDNKYCPICNKRTRYMASDVRPVFPNEIALLEILNSVKKGTYQKSSVWKGRTTYFVDGESIRISNKKLLEQDIKFLRKKLHRKILKTKQSKENINKFILANKKHLEVIVKEGTDYILNEAKSYDLKNIMVPFSGGKDSTATSHLVINAIKNYKVEHLFSNTTLESDETIRYVNRFKKNKNINLTIAKNTDNKFMKVARQIGPPTATGRWCCYMFKTGPINREMEKMFKGNVLTFYGVRKAESNSRSKYNRTENDSSKTKIANQRVASPIFYWGDFEVWLYILSNNYDFNNVYKQGFNRAGCWLCPNSTVINELLAKIYMPKKADKWYKFLINFAKNTGKKNAEEYIKSGNWKLRRGGNGIESSKLVKVDAKECVLEENALTFELHRKLTDDFYNLLIPLGKVIDGNKLIDEKVILNFKTNNPICAIQKIDDFKIKLVILDEKHSKVIARQVKYQVIKYNACFKCLKCESVCKFKAISIKNNKYRIDDKKCRRCGMCITSKYVSGGCLMTQYLATKKESK